MFWTTIAYAHPSVRMQESFDMTRYRVQCRVFWFWWETMLVTDSVKEARDMYSALVRTEEGE